MKLILSSCDFRNEKSKKTILNNLSKPVDQCKLLFIEYSGRIEHPGRFELNTFVAYD